MVRTVSTMLEIGTLAPDFFLTDATGKKVGLHDFDDKPALLIVFMCNHCPYVKHIADALSKFAKEYLPKGLAVAGINSNDADNYPDDSPEKMVDEVLQRDYSFPYLFDESQAVAKAYRAACTPDFFVFDANRKLVYRGQFDDSRPGNDAPVNGSDLRAAIDAVIAGKAPGTDQKPSMGCNIKWKPGNEPDYFS